MNHPQPQAAAVTVHRLFLVPLLVSALALALAPVASAADSEPGADAGGRQPNVLILLVDDLGWMDLGCYGSDLHETPNLDRLADEGVRFTDAYAACTVCSPSRAALLTGKYPARLNLTDWIEGHSAPNPPLRIPDWTRSLPHEEVTLAEALHDAGYRTAHVGKWHLMRQTEPRDEDLPTGHGFEINRGGLEIGQPGSYFWPYADPRGRARNLADFLPQGGAEGEYLTDRLTDEALAVIRDWADEPWFMHFSYYTVHTPIQGRPDLVEYYQDKIEREQPQLHTNAGYAAMVGALDESVGRVLDLLDELGLRDDTIILFTSDNGGLIGRNQPVTSNDPLRSGKGDAYEGGVRVPFIASWPGHFVEGNVSGAPVMGIDLYPTVLALTGVAGDPDHNANVDGMDISEAFTNPRGVVNEFAQRPLFWHYPHYHPLGARPHSAVRLDAWRLLQYHDDMRVELYHLNQDIGERTEQAGSHPEVTRELEELLEQWRLEVDAQMPTPNPEFDPTRPFPFGS